MRLFLDIMKYKTRYKAKKSCPWAVKISRCYMGWMAFDNLQDYEEYLHDKHI